MFGKAAGERCAKMAAQHLAPRAAQEVAPESLAQAFAHLDALRSLPRVGKAGGVSARELRTSCSQIMLRDGGIIREGVAMQRGLQELRECMEQFQHARQVSDASLVWNNELVQAIEAENLLLQAIACLSSAQFRTKKPGGRIIAVISHAGIIRTGWRTRSSCSMLIIILRSISVRCALTQIRQRSIRSSLKSVGIKFYSF